MDATPSPTRVGDQWPDGSDAAPDGGTEPPTVPPSSSSGWLAGWGKEELTPHTHTHTRQLGSAELELIPLSEFECECNRIVCKPVCGRCRHLWPPLRRRGRGDDASRCRRYCTDRALNQHPLFSPPPPPLSRSNSVRLYGADVRQNHLKRWWRWRAGSGTVEERWSTATHSPCTLPVHWPSQAAEATESFPSSTSSYERHSNRHSLR